MDSIPFPILFDEAPEQWRWPAPPFGWRKVSLPDDSAAQPCRIETRQGTTIEGDLLSIDGPAQTLRFRTSSLGAPVTLAFSRFRRLTLTTPLRPAMQPGGAEERVPAAAQEREYRLHLSDTGEPMTGHTAGHVETGEGLFLFLPVEEERSVQRIFVPRSAYIACEFGPSAEEAASKLWVGTPEDLLAAIERQPRAPVLPIGQALLNLGLLTQDQLDRFLARPPADLPLGEALVRNGTITRSDLNTALAYKMGYPLVDLARFPIDAAAVEKLPTRVILLARSLPLMIDRERLIVAVDKPARVDKLRSMHVLTQQTVVVPVLASKGQLVLALGRIQQHDVWSQSVSLRPGFFATTT